MNKCELLFDLILTLKVFRRFVEKPIMDVTGKILSIFIFIFVLSGCEEPDVEVSSLGKKLPAPKLTGESPFSQNFDGQGYARIQGSCDSRVGDIYISFDNTNWYKPPASPNITNTTLSAETTNDLSCTDGVFDVYITQNDIVNVWKIDPNSKTGISIYIKGETIIGDTEKLILTEDPSVPTKLILEKNQPRGFAGSDKCESFNIRVVDNKGNRINAASDILFQIQKLDTATNITGYANFDDCNTASNPLSNFKISANTDNTNIYYKWPTTPIDQSLSYKIVNQSSLSTDPNATQVVLRDSAANSNQWLSIEGFHHQIYKDACYPLTIVSRKYSHALSFESGNITVSSSSPDLKFFTDADCLYDAVPSQYTVQATDSSSIVYIKYVPSAISTNSFESATISINGSSYGGAVYDFSSFDFTIDLTSSNTPTYFELWGQQKLTMNSCAKYYLLTFNNNRTWIPVSADSFINLSTLEGINGFYTANSCAPDVSSASLTIFNRKPSGIFYFKPESGTPVNSAYNFKITSPGFKDLIRNWWLEP